MKTRNLIILGIASATIAITAVGCSLIGANPSAPNAAERYLFDIQTNLVAKTLFQTNVVDVTNHVVVFSTNEVGQIVTRTNEVVEKKYDLVTVTNMIEQYVLKDKPSTQAGVQAGGAMLNVVAPGAGGLFVGIAGAVLAAWRRLRSAKESGTVLAQNIEAIREFIKAAVPNGAQYDDAIVRFISEHQKEAGVAEFVVDLVKNRISNKDARASVSEIQGLLESFKRQAPAA